ncbi:MAG: class Ib ribonucleoside-diphosphate reductase assembly flavoprotein NrdI [Christensenellales bacterium]|jgi:protein involved in ribonucleotide reduction
MKVVCDSRTGLGKRFAEELSCPSQPVSAPVYESCILVTRNSGLGQIPKSTQSFLEQYGRLVRGVVVNGSKRFGRFYCAAGVKIESRYHIPILRNIEGEGTDEDANAVNASIREMQSGEGV